MSSVRFGLASLALLIMTAAASAVTVPLDATAQGAGVKGASYSPVSGLTLDASVALRGRRARRLFGNTAQVAIGDTGAGVLTGLKRDTASITRGESLKASFDTAVAGDTISMDLANYNITGRRRRRDNASLTVWFDGAGGPTVYNAAALAGALTDNGGGDMTLSLANLLGADASRLVSMISINAARRGRVSFEASSLSYGAAAPSSDETVANPEPVTASLAMVGLSALALATRRRRHAAN